MNQGIARHIEQAIAMSVGFQQLSGQYDLLLERAKETHATYLESGLYVHHCLDSDKTKENLTHPIVMDPAHTKWYGVR
jgi:hypothetical protein